jgi:hypothetical protein
MTEAAVLPLRTVSSRLTGTLATYPHQHHENGPGDAVTQGDLTTIANIRGHP